MVQFQSLALFALTLSLPVLVSGSACHSKCRCLPYEPCWPTRVQWQSLNESVDGNLALVHPVGALCHDPTFDQARCDELLAGLAYNSSFRAAEPGAGQWVNWEAWEAEGESCFVESEKTIPCGQGRVSPYSVAARSVDIIITAVKFAIEHNIRLIVKNTGHDFSGRSLAAHSLQVHTRHLKDIALSDDFVPHAAPEDAPGLGPAVTIGAGVQLMELYQFCHEKNISVVAGFSSTVGAAGGYIQGGGHSILGPWKGIASDNVVQFTVVTADGNHVYVNEHQNTDLFWALRGGGGGTFGIVTSVTLRTHPNAPLSHVSMQVVRPAADEQFWRLTERLYEHLPGLNDLGMSLSSIMYPSTVAPSLADGVPKQNRALLTLRGFLVGAATDGFMSALLSLETALRSATDNATLTSPANFHFNITTFPSIGHFYTAVLTGVDRGGAATVVGSRLISRDFIASPGGPAAIANALSSIQLSANEAIAGNVVSGGAVAANKDIDSALHPAWRRTLSHVMIVRGWAVGTPLEEQQAIHEELTHVQVPILEALKLPGEEMGSYLNEADGSELDFQRSFWGENYPRLYEIKKKWDPRGVFIVRRGVGSEDWDDEGLCRR